VYRDQHEICPRCQIALQLIELVTTHVAQLCRKCGGLWILPDEFQRLATTLASNATVDEARSQDTSASRLHCPVCRIGMISRRRYGSELDVCESHGVWFDHGELQAVLGATVSGSD
jgi:Zn-finger nucleic acid-binding protein